MIKNILTKCLLLICIMIGTVFSIEYVKDNPKTILSSVGLVKKEIGASKPLPQEGERLSYLIKYMWIMPIAEAEIRIGEKEDYKLHQVYPLTAKGKISKFVSIFIKAEGTIKSYVDVNKLYPWRYEEKTLAEGHRPSDKIIFYHQDAQIMEFKDIKRKIPENTQDPLSALFYLRWQKYEEDKDIVLTVNSNKENYTILAKLFGKDEVAVNGKKTKMLIANFFIKSPKEYSKSEAKITTFMIDDTTRIPLLLKVRTKFGPLTIRLTNVEYK